MAEQIPISTIQIGEPFVSLFRINEENYNDILRDMSENGFDQNEPLLIWEEENTLIDGHTRLKAAQELCVEEVPTLHLSFESENDAVWYSVKRNANRRSVTKGDKLRLVRILDKPMTKAEAGALGGKANSNLNVLEYDEDTEEAKESAKETAKIIGVGIVTIKKMRTINTYATQETIEAVENEEMSIDAAWKEAKAEKEKIEAERSAVKHFNRTTDSIEWALWTWNPVTGCKHGCKYCYARDIAKRFYPQGFEPTFHEARLSAPQDTPIPKLNKKEEPDNKTENNIEKTEITKEEKIRNELGEHNVFVCSMADLFGEWVPDEWIQAVFNSIETAPSWWNFLLLTKNPERYLELEFPSNCWIGATATNQEQMDRAISTFTKLRKQTENVLFLSCEPLMDEIEADLSCIDWLIIGGRSRSNKMPAGQPEWEWVAKLMRCADQAGLVEDDRVYWKPNLTVKPKGYPIKLEE